MIETRTTPKGHTYQVHQRTRFGDWVWLAKREPYDKKQILGARRPRRSDAIKDAEMILDNDDMREDFFHLAHISRDGWPDDI